MLVYFDENPKQGNRNMAEKSSIDIVNFRRMQERMKKRAQRRRKREKDTGPHHRVHNPAGLGENVWQVEHLNLGDRPAAPAPAPAPHAGFLHEIYHPNEIGEREWDTDNGERFMDGGGGDDDGDDGGGGGDDWENDDDDGDDGDDGDDSSPGDDSGDGDDEDDSGDYDGDDSGEEEAAQDILEHMPPPLPDMQRSLGSWEYDEERLLDGDDEQAKTRIGSFLTRMASGPGVSKAALQEIYQFFMQGAEDIARMKRRHNIVRRSRTLREKTMQEISPQVWTEVYRIGEIGPGEKGLILVDTVDVMREELQTDDTAVLHSYVSLKDIIGHAYRVHGIDINNVPQVWRKIEVNSDGVASSKSASAWDFHAVSLRFLPCGTPYLWRVIQYNKSRGGVIDMESIYRPIVQEVNANGYVQVVRFALDSKERKIALGMTTCQAYFSCTVCEEPGEVATGDEKQRVSYPKKFTPSTRRTRESIVRDSEVYAMRRRNMPATHRNMSIARWDAKGVLRRSVLLDLRNFNPIKGTPGDFMHMVIIGIGKKIYRLLFIERHKHLEPGEEKGDVKDRSQHQARDVDDFVTRVRIPKELGRRTRKVVFQQLKATEWRYYCLFLYLYIGLFILGEGDGTRRKILLLFTFVCRMFYLPDGKYNQIGNNNGLEPGMIMERLYKYYERSFGKGEMTFNEHLLFSHALDQREEHGPVTNYSCFRYEDLFGDVKDAYVKGTPNEAKQIFGSLYTTDYFFHHCRDKKTIRISPKRSRKRDDSLVTKNGEFFKVVNAGNEIIRCRKIQTNPLVTRGVDVDDLPWSSVGVFEKGDERRETENILRKDIDGKGIIVGNLIMSVGNSCLRE